MEFPLVSIIIPTYNRAVYLKEAIESVLAQTFTNFELIILDNHSTDNTPEVVSGFSDPRIKYIRHECNIRTHANWTYGIYLAQGEYISVICDDDWIASDFIKDRVCVLESDSKIVTVFGELFYFSSKSEVSQNNTDPKETIILSGPEALRLVLDKQLIASSMFRRQEIQDHWEKGLKGGKTADVLVCGLIALSAGMKAGFLKNSKDYFYRIHENQDSSSNRMEVANDGFVTYKILLQNSSGLFRRKIRKKIVDHWNRNGRIFWDMSMSDKALICFRNELKYNPLGFTTWIRLLRCLLFYKG
jgi:glycosyltransferase involved in cell wall biosynthesis